MRRVDREVRDPAEIEGIIGRCKVCRIAMFDGARPYIVPMNFGYEFAAGALTLFFHSAREGRKIDVMRHNPVVCFEMDIDGGLRPGADACAYGCAYESVIGDGAAAFIDDFAQKEHALRRIMEHAAGPGEWSFGRAAVDAVAVFSIAATGYSAKRRA